MAYGGTWGRAHDLFPADLLTSPLSSLFLLLEFHAGSPAVGGVPKPGFRATARTIISSG